MSAAASQISCGERPTVSRPRQIAMSADRRAFDASAFSRENSTVCRGLASDRPALLRRSRCDRVIASNCGVWLSLVERLVRDQEVASSNLVTPTFQKLHRNKGNCYLPTFGSAVFSSPPKRKIPFWRTTGRTAPCRNSQIRSDVPTAQTVRAGNRHAKWPRLSLRSARHPRQQNQIQPAGCRVAHQ